jgi:energy-coupling factor transporter ATP-binding protein EcfA2/SAM-dependent methyltransferase
MKPDYAPCCSSLKMFSIEARTLRHGESGVEYHIPKLSLLPGEIGLLVWDNHAGREALLASLTASAKTTFNGWVVERIIHCGGNFTGVNFEDAVLMARNPDAQLSNCLRRPLLEFALPLALTGQTPTEQRIKASFWLGVMNLSDSLGSDVSDFSTGQKQRLLLASAMATASALLVIDGGLEFIDPLSRARLLHFLEEVCVATGRALLFVAASSESFAAKTFSRTVRVPSIERRDRSKARTAAAPNINLEYTSSRMLIDVRSLSYHWPRSPIRLYNGLSFSITRGAIRTIVGPNGSGKSTLGQILAGRILPSMGSVQIDGIQAREWFGRHEPQIAFAFADPDLAFSKRSVEREIFSLAAGTLTDGDLGTILELLELDSLLGRNPFDLHWHARRRLCIAKAIRAAKAALFIDEPVSDSTLEQRMRFVTALEICAAKGLSVLVASNDALLISHFTDSESISLPPPKTIDGAQDRNSGRRWRFAVKRGHPQGGLFGHSAAEGWTARSTEFSTFWAMHVYPTLIEKLDLLIDCGPMLMVDLACGNGLHTAYLAAHLRAAGVVTDVIGVDREEQFISTAKSLFCTVQSAEFCIADLTDVEAVKALASRILAFELPVLFTSFFALHDLASLHGVRALLEQSMVRGGAFVAALVSPEFVSHHLREQLVNIHMPTERDQREAHICDWEWAGSFPVSIDKFVPFYVPYYHRSATSYLRMLQSFWNDVHQTLIQPNDSADPNAINIMEPCCRADEVWLLWTSYRAAGCRQ